MPFTIEQFEKGYSAKLGLELIAGEAGRDRPLNRLQAHRPGLALSGYMRGFVESRVLIFGQIEFHYLMSLEEKVRVKRLSALLTKKTPSVFLSKHCPPFPELVHLCQQRTIPLYKSSMSSTPLLSNSMVCFMELSAPMVHCHGTFVEVFGVGMLLQGESSVGKSEAALGLIERGHRLIADDLVKVTLKEERWLEGSGPEMVQHHMEIRGIGIINVAHLYGAVCVCDRQQIDCVVQIEHWNEECSYDRSGLNERFCQVLGVELPYHVLPVRPGRDVVLLLETLASNHRLKTMGYNAAVDFRRRLCQKIGQRTQRRQWHEKEV